MRVIFTTIQYYPEALKMLYFFLKYPGTVLQISYKKFKSFWTLYVFDSFSV